MVSKITSLRAAINALKQHQQMLEPQLGKSNLERLLFNLEEINLDIENFANELINAAKKEAALEQLTETVDSFQYGSIPHILGHLETIEELLENNCSTFPIPATGDTITQPVLTLSLQEIARLPVTERHQILAPFIPATAEDFLTDPELTEFSVLDGEDWENNDPN